MCLWHSLVRKPWRDISFFLFYLHSIIQLPVTILTGYLVNIHGKTKYTTWPSGASLFLMFACSLSSFSIDFACMIYCPNAICKFEMTLNNRWLIEFNCAARFKNRTLLTEIPQWPCTQNFELPCPMIPGKKADWSGFNKVYKMTGTLIKVNAILIQPSVCTSPIRRAWVNSDYLILKSVTTWTFGENSDQIPRYIYIYTTLTNFSRKYLVMCKVYTDTGGIK